MRIAKALTEVDRVVLSMGRRWGKTTLGGTLLVSTAARGARVAWVVPSYKNGRPLWRWVRQVLGGVRAAGLARFNETERTVEFDPSLGGGFLGIYSGDDNADSMRGDSFHLVVLDEASRIAESAWVDSIQPTLADFNGKAMLISTPRGQNWFYYEWLRGQDESQHDTRSFKAPTFDNPLPNIRKAFQLARERVPARTFKQEWLAEFIPDGGEVFHNVDAIIRGKMESGPVRPRWQYVMGIDLAKMDDYTAICVGDLRARKVVDFHRFNMDDWPLQKARIILIAQHWGNVQIYIDSTGVGSPIYDDLRQAGLNIVPYHFNAATKQSMYDNAILMVEQQEVSIPEDAPTVLINELKALQYKKTAGGNIKIEAPSGMHDDCATAFGLMCLPMAHAFTGLPQAALDQLHGKASEIGGIQILRRKL